jgi:hypothetical protein
MQSTYIIPTRTDRHTENEHEKFRLHHFDQGNN